MGSHRSGGRSITGASRGALVARFLLSAGLAGLLAGCPTVDLGDTPTDLGLCNPAGGFVYFQDVVWPEFVRPSNGTNGCTKTGGCHNEAGGNALSFKVNPVDLNFNFTHAKNFLNCGTPGESELLIKPLAGRVAHGGGDIFASGSDAAVVAFLEWFQ